MRFVHFSDTRLGFSDLHRIDPVKGINQRENDFYDAWWQAIGKIIELEPDFAVHAGDLFQSSRPNNRALSVAVEGIQKLAEAGIHFVVVSGNHSTPRIPQTGSIFESLAFLPNVSAAYQGKYERFTVGDCAIHCIPHCASQELCDAALKAVDFDPEAKYQILLAHGVWRNADNKSVGSLGEFNEQIIDDPKTYSGLKFDYIALGHYDNFLQIAPNAFYSGSTERVGFRAKDSATGIVLVDLAQNTHRHLELPSRPMRLLGPVDCRNVPIESIYSKIEEESRAVAKGDLVRLELSELSRDALLALEVQKIDTFFKNALHVEKRFTVAKTDSLKHPFGIGALSMEFERYLESQDDSGLDSQKLLNTGLSLLDHAEMQ